MLAVATSFLGVADESKFGSEFMKSFDGFTVIRLNPSGAFQEGRLQICQPEGYGDLLKGIRMSWDISGSLLELQGLKEKMQRLVRYMFFFDEEKKFTKVLLEGNDGINDFPWALQIVVLQPPLEIRERALEWLQSADIIVLTGAESEACRHFAVRLNKTLLGTPVYLEKLEQGLSPDLKTALEVLFTDYTIKRHLIREQLTARYPEQALSCKQARRMAGELRVSLFLFGSVCDELGYRITQCGLGCF